VSLDRRAGKIWTLGGLALLLLACCLPVFKESGKQGSTGGPRGLVKREAPSAGGRTQILRFEWEDPNSIPVVERHEDTFVRGDGEAERYSLSFAMDRDRLRRAMESYGIRPEWVEFSYESDEERLALFQQARARCARHGIRLEMEGDFIQMSPDGDWIVQNSRGDMAPLARGLYDAARGGNIRDQRGFLGMMASFVQGLEYKVPPDERKDADGAKITLCGVTMPLETLQNGSGDCDTKCFLLASVLANVRGVPAVFLEGERHMFIGVACPPRPGDRYVTVQGIDFVLVETTTPWPFGAIPRSIEDGLQANRYKVIPLSPAP
jgi:hypothetical protein